MPTTLIEFIYINSNTIKEDKRIHTVFIKDGEMFINIDMVECYSVGKFGGIKVNFNLAPVGWCYWPISLKSKISVEDVISYIGFAKKNIRTRGSSSYSGFNRRHSEDRKA